MLASPAESCPAALSVALQPDFALTALHNEQRCGLQPAAAELLRPAADAGCVPGLQPAGLQPPASAAGSEPEPADAALLLRLTWPSGWPESRPGQPCLLTPAAQPAEHGTEISGLPCLPGQSKAATPSLSTLHSRLGEQTNDRSTQLRGSPGKAVSEERPPGSATDSAHERAQSCPAYAITVSSKHNVGSTGACC